VTTQTVSYPPGYSLQNIEQKTVEVEVGKPANVEIRATAIRSIAGKITIYDRSKLESVPIANATVRLKELGLETKSGSNGAYLFRSLPAGVYTITATYGKAESSRKVTVPPEPANLRDIDLDVTER
jgi:hypothetical protein